MIEVDYETLAEDIASGTFRTRLEAELTAGFEQIKESGERLPPASYYATKIAEIVNAGGVVPESLTFDLYQEIVAACENARVNVGERVSDAPD